MQGIYRASALLLLHLFSVGNAENSSVCDTYLCDNKLSSSCNADRCKSLCKAASTDLNKCAGLKVDDLKNCVHLGTPSASGVAVWGAGYSAHGCAFEDANTRRLNLRRLAKEPKKADKNNILRNMLVGSANMIKKDVLKDKKDPSKVKAQRMFEGATVMAQAAKIAADKGDLISSYKGEGDYKGDTIKYKGDKVPHGLGVWSYTDAAPKGATPRYEGAWVNGEYQGLGVNRHTSENIKFGGEFAKGRENGLGVKWTHKGGVSDIGFWVEGKPSKPQT